MLKPLAFATALIVAGPAVAGLTASAPEEIVRFLQNEGFVVRIGEDSVGDPKISVRYYGTSFDILFRDYHLDIRKPLSIVGGCLSKSQRSSLVSSALPEISGALSGGQTGVVSRP